MNILEKIKKFFVKIKQELCDHEGSYTQIEYNVTDHCRRSVRKCEDCGYNKEKFAETERFLIERDKNY